MLYYISVFVPLLLTIVLATYIIPRILVVSVKKDLVIPSETKGKGRLRVPRLGGVSLFPILVISVGATIVLLMTFFSPSFLEKEDKMTFVQYMFGLAGLTTMYLLGVMDDLLGVSITSKLLIELLAALLIPLSGLWLDNFHGLLGIFEIPDWIGMPLTVFAVLYITNAIPMLDDVDGLASGLAIIAFAVLGGVSYQAGEPLLMIVCAAMSGMLMPFFYRNVMVRRIGWRNIYLGDTGGLTIGYVLSFVVIVLSRMGGTSLPEGAIMACFGTLIIPMFDVMRVSVTRMINHRNIFQRDNNHIHHRLIQGGMRPMSVLVTILIISTFFIVFNVIGVWSEWNLSLLLVADVMAWIIVQLVISYFKNKNRDLINYG
ncbi:MAG: undecaprenyl/decaprenyl-phosphate alpha-N-acetylglucosaminyl 1-phosphate transferase [Prevotella sp.]|nr:undecaprenyl/decaprenyl-phosphate alpha-N-acetylglucosaminyl 1-phosphate transferase [Prevotella sp.]